MHQIKSLAVVLVACVLLILFVYRYELINDSGPGIYVLNRWTGQLGHVTDDEWVPVKPANPTAND